MQDATIDAINGLLSPEPTERLGAVRRLGELATPGAITALLEALAWNDRWIERGLVQALAAIGEEVVPSLFGRMDSGTIPMARLAADALQIIGSPAVIEGLVERLGFPSHPLYDQIPNRLAQIGPQVIPHLLKSIKEFGMEEGTITALAALRHPETLPTLYAALKSRESTIRRTAVLGIGALPNKNTLSVIEELVIYDPDSFVRMGAIEALERLGNPDVIKVLFTATFDSSTEVRVAVLDTLLVYKDHVDDRIRLRAIDLSGSSSQIDIRYAAVTLLGEVGSIGVIPILEPMLKDRIRNTRDGRMLSEAVAIALKKIEARAVKT